MSDDARVLDCAAAWREQGLSVALATVTATWGSALRPAGSQLAVNERGDFAGSVSGGCVEGAVVREALGVIADGRPRRLTYGVSDERAWDVGLSCGGTIHVYVERVGCPEILAALRADLTAKRAAVLATWLEGGKAALLHPLEPSRPDVEAPPAALSEAARAALREDRARTVETSAGPVFLRPYNPPVRLVVVGAVHVAQALAPMARLAGLDAVVVDPRRAFATDERFAGCALVRAWPDEALEALHLDSRSAVVTLSHDAKLDDPALAAALRSPAFYVGALGSRTTQAARRERLRRMGFSEVELARVHGPVGLPIAAVTPAEIAVSILAELVAALRQGAPRAGPA